MTDDRWRRGQQETIDMEHSIQYLIDAPVNCVYDIHIINIYARTFHSRDFLS